jgi:hypothetical protein
LVAALPFDRVSLARASEEHRFTETLVSTEPSRQEPGTTRLWTTFALFPVGFALWWPAALITTTPATSSSSVALSER